MLRDCVPRCTERGGLVTLRPLVLPEGSTMALDMNTLRRGLALTLDATRFDWLGSRYEGKVRDNYVTADGRRVIVVSDRISAFDRVIGTLPFKGQVLNQLASYWFAQTASLVPNHV